MKTSDCFHNKPVRSLGNNENIHKADKESFSGCVLLLPVVTLSPVSPRMLVLGPCLPAPLGFPADSRY